MKTGTLKESVVKSYGQLAKTQNGIISKLFSCCDTSENAEAVGTIIGYSKEEMRNAPEGANLGVGCGNPSGLAGINEGETVVDLGSGAGFDAFIVSRIVGDKGKIIGIDLSDDMLKLARSNAKKGKYTNVKFLKGDIEQLPLEDEIADHVISNCVINLSANKGDVYSEAYRVLKKQGKISISDIILEEELPDFVKDSLAAHIACIAGAEKLETYLRYIEEAGFREITVHAKSPFPLELMLSDPQVMKVASALNFDLNSTDAKDLASRVKSISLTAIK